MKNELILLKKKKELLTFREIAKELKLRSPMTPCLWVNQNRISNAGLDRIRELWASELKKVERENK